MNSTKGLEPHENLVKRIDAERTELGRELRARNYTRAAGIANYISQQIYRYAEAQREAKQ